MCNDGIKQQAKNLIEANKPAEALRVLNAAICERESSELLNDWASAACLCGDSRVAESGYRRALQLDPSYRQAAVNLAALFLQQGRFDESIPVLQSVAGSLTEEESGQLRRLATSAEAAASPARSRPEMSSNTAVPLKDGKPEASIEASIIVPVWNKLDFTRRCVARIRETTPDHLYELVFVDNGSTDGTAEFLAGSGGLDGNVTVITNATNLGFVEASNQGARVAKGRFLIFLNNDTEPQPGWMEALLEMAIADPGIGAIGSKLVYPDGRLQEAGGMIFQDASGWNFGRFDDPSKAEFNKACEVDYCSGAALLVRREAFERLGGFDRRYTPAYYEDTDLCFGIRSLGLRVMYCPGSTVAHFEGTTAGTDPGSGFKRFQAVNREKFAVKWRDALARQDPSPAVTGKRPERADRARLSTPAPATVIPAGPPTVLPERAPGALHILVIDPFLPLYDVASGSLRLWRIVQLFRALGCRVTYIARNGTGQERYKKALEALGVVVYAADSEKIAQCGLASAAAPIDLARILSDPPCDLAWISFYDMAEQYLPDIRRLSPGTRIVVDTVDVHFLREARQAELIEDCPAAQAAREQVRITQRRETAIYGQADLVVTVTEADADALRKEGLKVPIDVIPNIHSAIRATPGWKSRRDLVFVGNFNHLPNIDAILWFCREIMPRVQALVPQTKLTIVGPNPPAEVKALSSPAIVVQGWVAETAPYLDRARVSIAPLRVGAGMKGKIGEALSRGIPVVTTSIGAEGMGLQDGEHAMIANDADSFAEAVVRLYTDRALWQRVARSGREFVETHYGTKAALDMLRTLLLRTSGTSGLQEPGASGPASNPLPHQVEHQAQVSAPAAHFGNPATKPTLGLSMIVRDAEADLARCLESVRGIVDEIVIGDTGSTDSSIEIARRYGARVIPVPWENDFGAARNRVLAENQADWILSLDADEMLEPETSKAIPALLARPDVAGYKVTIWNYVTTLNNRMWDSPAKPNPNRLDAARQYPAYVEHQNVRLFRRNPDVQFEGRVHETTGNRILNSGRKLDEASFVIHHFGLALGAEARFRKSILYRDLGRNKILENPNDAQSYFEVGIEELDTFRDPAAALSCFERVIQLRPRAHRGWAFAGIALVRLGKPAEGLARLRRATELGARNGVVIEAAADAHYQLGDFRAARRSYERAQRVGAVSALPESKIGVCDVRLGRKEQGLRRMRRALQREPEFIELYDLLIVAAVWAGDLQLAAETAEQRLKVAQPTPEGYMRPASIRARLKQWPAALEILQAGCERFPGAETLRQALGQVRQKIPQVSLSLVA